MMTMTMVIIIIIIITSAQGISDTEGEEEKIG